ncbi:MAG: Spy/CpxP family protein refolding chaperone [Bradyrhizobium sp.]|nr:Spy/CpxP family protein refolding chaperone [Bradyrhizobium sp.]
MKKFAIAGVAALAIAGSTAVYAQHHRSWSHHHERMNPEDRAAFTDARIAAVKAGLKLSAEQEKLWPPVEAAVREFAKLRIDRANARMNTRRDESGDGQRQDTDPVTRLRDRADTMASTAAAMKRIADAADPLYQTLDDGQKRRLAILTHMEGRYGRGGRHHGYHRGMDRDDGGRDRGFYRDRTDRDGGPGRDRGGPERL